MKHSVHSLRELPLLYMTGENDMGFKHKKTDEVLDRIIQVIWHYQQTHNNETPTQQFIFNELVEGKLLGGASPSSMTWYTRLLIDDDRIEKISSRPFRVTIRQHPKNRSAILRASRALEAQAALEAKPQPAPATPMAAAEVNVAEACAVGGEAGCPEPGPKPEVQAPQQVLADAHRAFADTLDPVERVTTEPRRSYVPERNMNWREAEQIIAAHGGNLLNIASQYIMSTARAGDLLEQLLDRGYTVTKTNPRWRD